MVSAIMKPLWWSGVVVLATLLTAEGWSPPTHTDLCSAPVAHAHSQSPNTCHDPCYLSKKVDGTLIPESSKGVDF